MSLSDESAVETHYDLVSGEASQRHNHQVLLAEDESALPTDEDEVRAGSRYRVPGEPRHSVLLLPGR